MLKRIISIVYIVALLATVVCVPLSAIFIIVKLCGASAMSWLACCMPVIVVLAILPLLLISKFLLDQKGG